MECERLTNEVNSGGRLKKRKGILTQENGKLNTKKLDMVDGESRGTMDHIKGKKEGQECKNRTKHDSM
jgi:hypothetical protein